MNSILMLMMMTGGSMGAGLGPMIIQQKRARFEKWKSFIMFLQILLVQGFFYWRGIPVVQIPNPAGGGTITPPPGTTLDALMSQIQLGQQDVLTQWFIRDVVERGVALILDLIAPSALEETLMTQMLSHMGGHPQQPQHQPQAITPNQVRAGGPSAQAPVYHP